MSEERTNCLEPVGSDYDDKEICPVCGGRNDVKATDTMDYIVLEADTVCIKCGDKNFWAHGFFLSNQNNEVRDASPHATNNSGG